MALVDPGPPVVAALLPAPTRENAGRAFFRVTKIFTQNAGRIREVDDVIAEEKIVLDNVPDEPSIKIQSALARSCCAVVAPPRPKEVPRPGTVLLCHIRAWLDMHTIPRPRVKSFLMR